MAGLSISIGNFDGVHLGHRALVEAARDAVGPDGRVLILSFDPHPASILRPEAVPARLGTFEQRSARLREAGADVVERLDPAGGVLGRTAEAFVDAIVERHAPSCWVEGPDFRFGRGRAGDVETLRAMGDRAGFEVRVVDPVVAPLTSHQLVPVRSTMIRALLTQGRTGDAAALLGRPYDLIARVVSGDRRGRTIGVPTANLDAGDRLVPADGVYAGLATDPEGGEHPAAINVGTNPTFEGKRVRRCEVHLVGWDGPVDVYEWTIRVRFVRWLRGPVRFRGPDALVSQIGRDIDRVRSLMAPDAVTRPTDDAPYPSSGVSAP